MLSIRRDSTFHLPLGRLINPDLVRSLFAKPASGKDTDRRRSRILDLLHRRHRQNC